MIALHVGSRIKEQYSWYWSVYFGDEHTQDSRVTKGNKLGYSQDDIGFRKLVMAAGLIHELVCHPAVGPLNS
jgi:hypothetical protein